MYEYLLDYAPCKIWLSLFFFVFLSWSCTSRKDEPRKKKEKTMSKEKKREKWLAIPVMSSSPSFYKSIPFFFPLPWNMDVTSSKMYVYVVLVRTACLPLGIKNYISNILYWVTMTKQNKLLCDVCYTAFLSLGPYCYISCTVTTALLFSDITHSYLLFSAGKDSF